MVILVNCIQGLHYLILSFKNCNFDLSCTSSLRLLVEAELAFDLRGLSQEQELQSCGLLDEVGSY